MFENKSNVNLHRHPSTDKTWFEVRFDIQECIVGIDGDWTAHKNKVYLDFSGYRREFDSSSSYETHRVHPSKSWPDIDIKDLALVTVSDGLIAAWEKGGLECIQFSQDLVYWHTLSIQEAKRLLCRDSIEFTLNQTICSAINDFCETHSISHAESVSKVSRCPHVLEQFVYEHPMDWRVEEISPGFKIVYQQGKVIFTITPVDIVHWRSHNSSEIVSEQQAIAQLREFRFV